MPALKLGTQGMSTGGEWEGKTLLSHTPRGSFAHFRIRSLPCWEAPGLTAAKCVCKADVTC